MTKRLLHILVLLLFPLGAAFAQALQPFTVLSNNSDIANKKLYVEISYEKPSCGDYQAMFKLTDRSGLNVQVPIDSVMNNQGTYELSVDKKALMRPQAGGYKLRFNLPDNAKLSDSMRVCIESYKLAYRCKGCGPGSSDAIFEPGNIKEGCPYRDGDVLACHQRKGEVANWEAWIQDPRDCKPYRIVQMPDDSWWFAQNLNYQKDLVGLVNARDQGGATGVGYFWCPGAFNSLTSFNSDLSSCETYGALYTWNAMMSLDGRGALQVAVPQAEPSSTSGICPAGWYAPGYYDWGVMLNAVEGCANPTQNAVAPCNHLTSMTTSAWFGAKAAKYLKSTKTCPVPTPSPSVLAGLQTPCADAANPSWTYYLDDPKIPRSSLLGEDRYGMSIVAPGRRYGASATVGSFDHTVGKESFYWTASDFGNANASTRYFYANDNRVNNCGDCGWSKAAYALPVRCKKGGYATMNFNYTGGVQAITLQPGKYRMEVWGASGGGTAPLPATVGSRAGAGGYAKGVVTITAPQTFYIYVGGGGTYTSVNHSGGFNGGGTGGPNGGSGGGASDIRLVGGTWNNINGLRSRIIVAGGGGGSDDAGGTAGGSSDGSGGNGGGISGSMGLTNGVATVPGATQTIGNAFGVGGNALSSTDAGGGGGGYFGGYGAIAPYTATPSASGGSGGSGFVSGMSGCNAVEQGTETPSGQPNHYSGVVFTEPEMQTGVRYHVSGNAGVHGKVVIERLKE